MKEVSEEVFYKAIGSLNVHPQICGNWPYTIKFKTPSGAERGRIVECLPRVGGLAQRAYYLPDDVQALH